MTARIRVLAPGVSSRLVDLGRPRSRSLGVSVGGAAHRANHTLANAMLGNPPDAVALEITLAGPSLVADADVACVLWGDFDATLGDGRVRPFATFTLPAGTTLVVGGSATAVRGYLAVAGGFRCRETLGSRSALRPLVAGDELACAASATTTRWVDPASIDVDRPSPLRVVAGPQADWFPADALRRRFKVSRSSDRMGLRLEHEPLPWPGREMVSEPVCPGTVQVTREGACIVLGVDGQTIGGYPRVAQVISADLDRLADLRPGGEVGFEDVSVGEAEDLFAEREIRLRRWRVRLALTAT